MALASRGLRDFDQGPEPERDASQRNLARRAAWNLALEGVVAAAISGAVLAIVLAVAGSVQSG